MRVGANSGVTRASNPGSVDANLFLNPTATCWFKESAQNLLDRVPGYLNLLDRYSPAWAERRSQNPGQILYEDDLQVVVIPGPEADSHRRA